MRFTYRGQEWETVRYGCPQKDDWFLDTQDQVPELATRTFTDFSVRLLIRRVPVTYTFGGITFEVQRVGQPNEGEWCLGVCEDKAYIWSYGSAAKQTILRPINVINNA